MPRAVGPIAVGNYGGRSDDMKEPLTGGTPRIQDETSQYTLDRGMAFEGRSCNDPVFIVVYLASLGAAVAAGIAAFEAANFDLAPPAELGCPEGAASGLLGAADPIGVASFESFLDAFKAKAPWLVPTVVGSSAGIGFLYLQALRVCAKPMVYVSLMIWPIGMIAGAIAIMTLPADSVGDMPTSARQITMAILLAMVALYLCVLCCCRARIALTIRTLRTAGEALTATSPVFITCLLLFVVWLALAAPLCAVMVVSIFNGDWSTVGDPVTACEYRLNNKGVAALALGGFMFVWSSLLFTEIRGFVVGGTIGHWYYHSNDATPPLNWPSLTASKHAFSKSFGSLCFGSLILALIQVVLFFIEMARNSARQSNNVGLKIVLCIVECIVRCIYDLIRMFTGFVTVVCSISGLTFWCAPPTPPFPPFSSTKSLLC